MKSDFYLILGKDSEGKTIFAQQLGGSTYIPISITYRPEAAIRLKDYKTARKYQEKIKHVYPNRIWTIVKYKMDVEAVSWALLTKNKVNEYENIIDIAEEETKLTKEDINEIEKCPIGDERRNSCSSERK